MQRLFDCLIFSLSGKSCPDLHFSGSSCLPDMSYSIKWDLTNKPDQLIKKPLKMIKVPGEKKFDFNN